MVIVLAGLWVWPSGSCTIVAYYLCRRKKELRKLRLKERRAKEEEEMAKKNLAKKEKSELQERQMEYDRQARVKAKMALEMEAKLKKLEIARSLQG